ncbi:MAG: hypothetical protein ACRDGN_05345 [bacterium]
MDQEVAAWHAVQHGESALAVVDEAGQFRGFIPPHTSWPCCSANTKKT